MRIFVAGIMQGSRQDRSLYPQQYRQRLVDLLRQHFPDAAVYDPLADHQQSVSYNDQEGREVFYRHNEMCRQVDVLIAFLPEASMGTAIEMWEAYRYGRAVVIAISPMHRNWVVRFCSHQVYPDLEAFAAALEAGQVQALITARQP